MSRWDRKFRPRLIEIFLKIWTAWADAKKNGEIESASVFERSFFFVIIDGSVTQERRHILRVFATNEPPVT